MERNKFDSSFSIKKMNMRQEGIEPSDQPWKGCMLPLHH